jgi:hypothetical protein
MSHSTCRACGESKPLDQFTVRKETGKVRSECKPCRSTSQAAARYGVSVGEVIALAQAQGNRCAICKIHADDIAHGTFKHNPLVIDHDHQTGAVRGLLCPNCNPMLGHAKDDVNLLANAISYLTKAI